MSTSLHCRLEPRRQRAAESAGLALLATVAACALALSDLPPVATAILWLLATGLAFAELRRVRPDLLRRLADGSLEIVFRRSDVAATCTAWRQYGPWLLLEFRDARGRRRAARLMPALLPAEQQRQLGRLLAGQRAAGAPSV